MNLEWVGWNVHGKWSLGSVYSMGWAKKMRCWVSQQSQVSHRASTQRSLSGEKIVFFSKKYVFSPYIYSKSLWNLYSTDSTESLCVTKKKISPRLTVIMSQCNDLHCVQQFENIFSIFSLFTTLCTPVREFKKKNRMIILYNCIKRVMSRFFTVLSWYWVCLTDSQSRVHSVKKKKRLPLNQFRIQFPIEYPIPNQFSNKQTDSLCLWVNTSVRLQKKKVLCNPHSSTECGR